MAGCTQDVSDLPSLPEPKESDGFIMVDLGEIVSLRELVFHY